MLKKIISGGFANLIFILVTMIVALTRSSLAVRYLPNGEAGIWFIFWNVIAFVSLCDFGLSPTLSREIGFSSKKANATLRISNLYFTSRKLINCLSIIALSTLVFVGYFYFYHLPLNVVEMRRILFAFSIFAVGVIIQLQANPSLAVIYGTGDVATERYIRACGPAFGVVVSLLLVIKENYGIYGLVLGYLSQTIFVYFLSVFFLMKTITLSKKGRYLRIVFKRIFEPSMQWAIMSIGAIFIFQISNFIIGYLMGVEYVPQFAILFQISAIIITLAGIVGYVLTPYVSQAKSRNDIKLIEYYLTVSTRASSAIALTLAIFFFLFGSSVVHVWLGKSFVLHKNALLVLLITTVLEVHHVSCAVIAMAAGYVKFAMIAVIAGVLNIIFSFIFIHYWGIVGAAFAIFVSQILTNNWYAVFLSLKFLDYSSKQYLLKIVLPLTIFGFSVFVCSFLLRFFLLDVSNVYVLLPISVIVTTMFAVLGFFFILLSTQERSWLMLKYIKFRGKTL